MAVLTAEQKKEKVRAFADRIGASITEITTVLEAAVQAIEDDIPNAATSMRTAIDVATAPTVLPAAAKNLLIKIVVADRIGAI